MRLPPRVAAPAVVLLVGLLLAGCGASVSVGDDGSKTVDQADVETLDQADIGFTFDHPAAFEKVKVDAKNTQGKVRVLLGIDDNNLIAVRQFAPKAAPSASDLKAAAVSFATANGVPASAVSVGKRSGIDVATFDTATKVDGTNTANAENVFAIGGATWQLECQSTQDHTAAVRKACDTALDSIKPK